MTKIVNHSEDGKLLGFYDEKIHKVIPEPNIEITNIEWENALAGGTQNYKIENSIIILCTYNFYGTIENAKISKINQFNKFAYNELSKTDWKITRHKEQIEIENETSLINEEYILLLNERQIIRDKSNNLEIQVNNCSTIEEVEAVSW